MKKNNYKMLVPAIVILLASTLSLAQDNQVNWYSFNSGAGVSDSANAILFSSIGTLSGAKSSNDSTTINSGFLGYNSLIITDVAGEKNPLPTSFDLHQNYPNPFNPSTIIQFVIPKSSFVNLKVYDILGKEVTTLVNENKEPGYYNVNFDGYKLASGIYIYRIVAGSYISTKKMLLIK